MLKSDNDLNKSRNESNNSFPSDIENQLFTPVKKGAVLKITPKQTLQRLPIVFAQVKAGNYSENLSNEIRKIVYSFYEIDFQRGEESIVLSNLGIYYT